MPLDLTKTVGYVLHKGRGEAVTIGAASAKTAAAFPDGVNMVRVVSNVDCFVTVDVFASATAVANTSLFLPAGNVEYFAAEPGDTVAVIQSAAAGTLYVYPLN